MEADEAVGAVWEEILSRKPMEESNERKSPANAAVSFGPCDLYLSGRREDRLSRMYLSLSFPAG